MVPIRLNNVSNSEIGNNDPSQNCQPFGAKLPANIRISPTYGFDIASLRQFRLGKMPTSAMTKLIVRYGCLFSCGWLPPLAAIAAGASGVGEPPSA